MTKNEARQALSDTQALLEELASVKRIAADEIERNDKLEQDLVALRTREAEGAALLRLVLAELRHAHDGKIVPRIEPARQWLLRRDEEEARR